MSKSLIEVGHLLRHKVDKKTEGDLLRVVHCDSEKDQCWIVKVSVGPPPRGTLRPRAQSLKMIENNLEGKFVRIDECVLTETFIQLVQTVETRRAQCQSRFKVIEPLVSPQGLALLDEVHRFSAAIEARAKATSETELQVRKYLTSFWWYGSSPIGLASRTFQRGGRGVPRSSKLKLGRRNALELLNPAADRLGVNARSPFHWSRMLKAVDECVIGQNMSIAKAYTHLAEYYFVDGIDADGNPTRHPVSARKIPTIATFKFHAPELILKINNSKELLGKKAYQAVTGRSYGAQSDIAANPGDLADIDGTGAKFETTAGVERRDRAGSPTLMFMVDRGSTCIVGVAGSMQAESSELYKMCMFFCFTDKSKLLREYGLDTSGFDFSYVPRGIFVDRGPGNSKDIAYSLIENLKISRATAPSHTPEAKSIVENINGQAHEALAHEPGARRRRRGKRYEEQRADARRDAKFTFKEWFRKVLEFAKEHNLSAGVGRHVTGRMRRKGVEQTPVGLLKEGLSQRRGGLMLAHTAQELYTKLLKFEERAVYPDGVRIGHARYYSDDLYGWRTRYVSQHAYKIYRNNGRLGEQPKALVARDPLVPEIIYWKRDDGSMSVLDATKESRAQLDTFSTEEAESFAFLDQAKAIERSRSKLSRAQQGAMKDAALRVPEKAARPSSRPTKKVKADVLRTEKSERRRRAQEITGRLVKSESQSTEWVLDDNDDGLIPEDEFLSTPKKKR